MLNQQGFTRDTEVTAKLPQKRTRQYIYDLLTKTNFPIKNIESIVERRGGLVDFMCGTVPQAKQLAAALRRHHGVEFARHVLSEYTDIKVHWIPGCFTNLLKAASHGIRLQLAIRLMANGSLHTSSVGRVKVNFLGFDRLPAYLKLF